LKEYAIDSDAFGISDLAQMMICYSFDNIEDFEEWVSEELAGEDEEESEEATEEEE